jgi:hypothetical protein
MKAFVHVVIFSVFVFVVFCSSIGFAQTQVATTVGGHIGVVSPLVVVSGSNASYIGSTPLGFPTGITVKPGGNFVFDFEFVPFVQVFPAGRGTQRVILADFLFHPGIIYTGAGGGLGIGVRGAIEFSGSVGFTGIVNKSLFPVGDKGNVFAELVLPVRFTGERTILAVALHIGIGF